MVQEMAHIEIVPGKYAEFEAAVTQAIPLFNRAAGCAEVKLHRIIEQPDRYVLVVRWNSLEDHTVRFRQSEDFQEWRRLVSPYFKTPPEVVHTVIAVE
ncbi:antibiotic biosynthesis monooxygenase family protein [Paraburkholderia graminis]|uniref:Heme-degrading monooxygenase HmoA n=1 Tax=Paraburkholderia graminis TaxID=60548 RepID=A0ABD5CTX3_9BURK|nr:antibiotic biosynthesis monooxygenase family protein [Paraburkholderia graminis]MDR6208250.1 heme-degrading monooxygenase HmoA [Paraburkholderia graminis]